MFPFSVDIVVGSKPPIRDSIWLMDPVEAKSHPNRFMIVEIAPILPFVTNRNNSIISMDTSRGDELGTNSVASPKRNVPTSFNFCESEYTKVRDILYRSARLVIVPHTPFIMA
jgi:hypothetical protein